MRNELPSKINKIECGIVNLDDKEGDGTHWTAYIKCNANISYFDSYGNLRPPLELINYFYSDGSNNKIVYNYNSYQKFNSIICGHLCLKFLYENTHT